MTLSERLGNCQKDVDAWLSQVKKAAGAVQRLRKAVASGNLRSIERLREAALAATNGAVERARECPPFDFDAEAYLAADGAFLAELRAAVEAEGVRIYVRDGVAYCYPVLLRTEPESTAVRVDKRLEASIRPGVLAGLLKKLQGTPPKSRPEAFVEALFQACELVRQRAALAADIPVPLSDVYRALTLLPGSSREYTELDFARDL